jgi:hypothetical protein
MVLPGTFALALVAQIATAPELRVEAPPELDGVRVRIESVTPESLADILRITGLADPGPPIRVVLAGEHSEWARRMPPWIAGLAFGSDLIVLFPSRTPGYPHDSLEDVLRHEVAHICIARAAGGRPVPRWFHEGLATAAERPWDLRDRTRLVYELVTGPRLTLEQMNVLFDGDRGAQTRAYAISARFVRDLLEAHGGTAGAEILSHLSDGVAFEPAFARATGRTLLAAEAEFWERQRTWTTWFPLVTSTTTVWIVIMLLALWAVRRRRRMRAAQRRRWEEEERESPRRDAPHDAGGRDAS